MPVKGKDEFFGEFENEHLLSRQLFADDARTMILKDLGYTQDMSGNRRSLFINSEITEQLALASANDPFKQSLVESR